MTHHFNEEDVLNQLKHFLPAQAPLKDFVHHNSLHSFQDKEFFEGIFNASKIFGFQVVFNVEEYRELHKQGRIRDEILDRVIVKRHGEARLKAYKDKMLNEVFHYKYRPLVGQLRSKWKQVYKIDLDNFVQPLLFRLLGSYLDQGIAIWSFPFEDQGLIQAVRMLEKNSFSSFFRSKGVIELLFSTDLSITKLLEIIVGDEVYFDNYLFDQQFSHKGWSGIASAIESNPDSIFYKKNIQLKDFIILELLLEIDALDRNLGKKWIPLSNSLTEPPKNYFADYTKSDFDEVQELWQEAFEWDYYDEVLSAVGHLSKLNRIPKRKNQSFQAMFCIDDRECSLRRYLESVDPNCETLGAPGFYGAAIYFQPYGGKFYDKNCPVALTPKHLIKEVDVKQNRKHEVFHSKQTHKFLRGFLSVFTIGLLAGLKMTIDLIRPKMQADISNAFAHMDVDGKLLIENTGSDQVENGLQIGYRVDEMVDIVENLLRGIGLTDNFTDVVYVVAHGSSSANNPHHGAHDCGACSGRPGAVNARVFSYMVNHIDVRTLLIGRGIVIPDTTQFLGAMHDTASDEVAFYDEEILTEINQVSHQLHKNTFEEALDLNAKERARRFASINIHKDIKHIRDEIKKRSVSYFEPRPELGHGTNALCHVGSRERIKGLFFDRRAFLQSYDYRTDPDGVILQQVLGPLPGVCGGINLEYYFSRMDIEKMGAGTKLPHNVTGLIGVTNSSDGDLRTGLPLQMIENHDPVRLLMMIEHRPDVILKVIKSTQENYEWFEKGWIHLVAINPENDKLYYFRNGDFEEYNPLAKINQAEDILRTIEVAKKMETNHILDATKENIQTQVYSK